MTSPQRANDVESIAFAVLQQLAPEELPTFDQAADRFRSAPDRPPAARSDDDLGFGEVVIGLVSAPFTLWLIQETLSFAAGLARPTVTRVTKPLRSRIRQALLRLPVLGRLWRPKTPVATAPSQPLGTENLARVRAACVDRASAAGIAPSTAELLADAIVGRLAVQP